MPSLFTNLKNRLGRLDGVTQADLDDLLHTARTEATAEEERLKAAVSAALEAGKAEAQAIVQDKGPELNAALSSALQAVEARISQALASSQSAVPPLQPATDESGLPTQGAGLEPQSGPAAEYVPVTTTQPGAYPGPPVTPGTDSAPQPGATPQPDEAEAEQEHREEEAPTTTPDEAETAQAEPQAPAGVQFQQDEAAPDEPAKS